MTAKATGPSLVIVDELITLRDATVEVALDVIVSVVGTILLSDFFAKAILHCLFRLISSSVSAVGTQQSSQQRLLSTSSI